MTTDCIDTAARPTFSLEVSDRHLSQAVVAAALAVILIIPGFVGALALFG